MKKIKVLCLLLVMTMLIISFSSCSKSKDYTLTVSIVNNETGDTILDSSELTITGTEDDPPTILEVAQKVLANWDISYSLSDDGRSIITIDGIEAESTEFESETNVTVKETKVVDYITEYYWDCMINGRLSATGKMDVTDVDDGDVLQFVYTTVTQVNQTGNVIAADTTAASN